MRKIKSRVSIVAIILTAICIVANILYAIEYEYSLFYGFIITVLVVGCGSGLRASYEADING